VPRPTPARILYLLIGLVLGLVVALAVQRFVLPGLVASLPFGNTPPPPVVSTGPSQFTAATLERVAAVNLAQERNGVTVRLNALELYQDGFALTYAVLSGRAGVSAPTLEPEGFQVSDDRGTSYTISPLGTGASLSSGFTAGMASFTPAPPADVGQVRVVVPNVIAVGLRLREGQARVMAGPWEFVVPIR
jgi:hypothetical protein